MTPFEDEKDAARLANDSRYGLYATVWTRDGARGHRLARQIKAGTVGINMPYTAFPGIPFGGYKQSGFGRELGLETLDLYLETKSVLVSNVRQAVQPVRCRACASCVGSTRRPRRSSPRGSGRRRKRRHGRRSRTAPSRLSCSRAGMPRTTSIHSSSTRTRCRSATASSGVTTGRGESLARLVVAPDERGRGLGTELATMLCAEARRRFPYDVWLRSFRKTPTRSRHTRAGLRASASDEEAFNRDQPRTYAWMRAQ